MKLSVPAGRFATVGATDTQLRRIPLGHQFTVASWHASSRAAVTQNANPGITFRPTTECLLLKALRHVQCQARRRYDDYDDDDEPRRRRRGGADDESEQTGFEINLNGNRITVSRDNLWTLAIPALMVLGLAGIIGPLIVGVAVAAVAVGAAMSVGAFALSLFWVPFMMMFGFLAFSFFLPFGAFATLGLGLFMPKILSFGIALAGVGLGWSVVSRLLPSKSATPRMTINQQQGSGKRGSKKEARSGYDDGPVVQAETRELSPEEQEVRRMAAELREFDSLLAEAEEKKRVDEWRKKTMGQ